MDTLKTIGAWALIALAALMLFHIQQDLRMGACINDGSSVAECNDWFDYVDTMSE